MTRFQCVKTGCLVQLPYSTYHWGDLHSDGKYYAFNAAVERRTAEALEVDPVDYGPEACCITVPQGVSFFLRRGVLVIEARLAVPNKALLDHLAEAAARFGG